MRTFRDMLNLIFIPSLLISIPYILLCIPAFFGYVPFEVTFDSMSPTFNDGELVYYELCNKSDLHENDFVVYDDYELENNRIFHRIVEVKEDGLVTKGDSQTFNDTNLLKYGDVVGKLTSVKFPAIGPYLKFAKSNIIIIYLSIGVWSFYLFINMLIVIKDMKVKKAMKLATNQGATPNNQQVTPVSVAPTVVPTSIPSPTPDVVNPAPVVTEAPSPIPTQMVSTEPSQIVPTQAPSPTSGQ